MGNLYDRWLESPYNDREKLDEANEKMLEDEIWGVQRDLAQSSLAQAEQLCWDYLDDRCITFLAKLMQEHSRNLSNAATPEFARLVVHMIEAEVERIAKIKMENQG